jgi:hypothetical protein
MKGVFMSMKEAFISMKAVVHVGATLLRNVYGDVSDISVLVGDMRFALEKSGGLAARVSRWRPMAAFDTVTPKILALYDRWADSTSRSTGLTWWSELTAVRQRGPGQAWPG